MTQDHDSPCNHSGNKTFSELLLDRRHLLRLGVGAAASLIIGLPAVLRPRAALSAEPAKGLALLGFAGIGPSREDAVRVPSGYSARVLYAWGDPVSDGPAFKPDASNTAAEQALQAGMHHDGMWFFPIPEAPGKGSGAAITRGLLAINHEYADDGLLHTDGMANWTAEKVRKSQAALGVSIIEIRRDAKGRWDVVRPSTYARRATAYTPAILSGPAAGHALLQTEADPKGRQVLGTLGNCACGATPWGTYLTCEENFSIYFTSEGEIPADQRRYRVKPQGYGFRWEEFDPRFNARLHPNEPNRFGWVVEIDPLRPEQAPIKRTALGRCKHESATVALAADGRVVVYMGDDEANEYIYKFVSLRHYAKNSNKNIELLDNGTLYVAKFQADGSGRWLALRHGEMGLTPDQGFGSPAEVLVKTRQAADRLGATKMDRPEWIAVHPKDGAVYCSLTNNSGRGMGAGNPDVDKANPRAGNIFGHILRWNEDGGDRAALRFRWDIFVLCGDPAQRDAAKRGTVKGDGFGSPDGLMFDPDRRLWIQTDVSNTVLNRGDYAALGNNQMLAADPASGEIRRFLTGPRGCEITGAFMLPDGKALLVNIQHPGESPAERGDPRNPKAVSSWPDGERGGRPRSATVIITRDDGGQIGGA